MPRIVRALQSGDLGFDTIQEIDSRSALRLSIRGMKFALRYLGSLTDSEVGILNTAGLGVMPVTYGNQYSGPPAVRELQACNMPRGITVWLDVETVKLPKGQLIAAINDWAGALRQAGFDPGIYVGWGTNLTGPELYALGVDRYWHACSRITDDAGLLAEPICGWAMYQLNPPNRIIDGVKVDVDVVQADFRGRLPSACFSTL